MKRRRLDSSQAKSKGSKKKKSNVPTQAQGKLTGALIEQFCGLVLEGLPFDACCDYIGINPSTFWSWRNKGKAFLDNEELPEKHELHGQFVLALRYALAKYRLKITRFAHSPLVDNWVQWMTILERRDRTTWSRQDQGGEVDESEYDADEKFV